MNHKALDELYEYLEELKQLSTYAEAYQGNINLGDRKVSLEELQEELKNIKAEIAVRLSQNKLRIINQRKIK